MPSRLTSIVPRSLPKSSAGSVMIRPLGDERRVAEHDQVDAERVARVVLNGVVEHDLDVAAGAEREDLVVRPVARTVRPVVPPLRVDDRHGVVGAARPVGRPPLRRTEHGVRVVVVVGRAAAVGADDDRGELSVRHRNAQQREQHRQRSSSKEPHSLTSYSS